MKKVIAILFAVFITELTGNYNYTNSGNFSFSATMDTNGTLNGTWGNGSNPRGSGRWMMSKQ